MRKDTFLEGLDRNDNKIFFGLKFYIKKMTKNRKQKIEIV